MGRLAILKPDNTEDRLPLIAQTLDCTKDCIGPAETGLAKVHRILKAADVASLEMLTVNFPHCLTPGVHSRFCQVRTFLNDGKRSTSRLHLFFCFGAQYKNGKESEDWQGVLEIDFCPALCPFPLPIAVSH